MQCKECGADLPEEARFCLQCGAPVKPERKEVSGTEFGRPGPPPELDFFQPALAGGTFLGLLSSLPLISAGNCLCCMWIIGGGGLSTYLLSKQQTSRKLTYGDGAFAGVLSGLFGAIVGTLISIPVKLLTARIMPSQPQSLDALFQNMPELDVQSRELLMRLLSPELSAVTITLTFISNLIMYALFAMIGGILAVVVIQRRGSGLEEPPPRQWMGN